MPEKGRLKQLEHRKTEIARHNDLLRNRAAALWREADRPIRALEEGIGRLRRIHPIAAGAVGVGLFLARRKLAGRRALLGPLLSVGWIAAEMALNRKSAPRQPMRPLPRSKRGSEDQPRLPEG